MREVVLCFLSCLKKLFSANYDLRLPRGFDGRDPEGRDPVLFGPVRGLLDELTGPRFRVPYTLPGNAGRQERFSTLPDSLPTARIPRSSCRGPRRSVACSADGRGLSSVLFGPPVLKLEDRAGPWFRVPYTLPDDAGRQDRFSSRPGSLLTTPTLGSSCRGPL